MTKIEIRDASRSSKFHDITLGHIAKRAMHNDVYSKAFSQGNLSGSQKPIGLIRENRGSFSKQANDNIAHASGTSNRGSKDQE
jgi:hypothetical protein